MSLLATYQQDIRTTFPDTVERDEWRNIRNGLLNAAVEEMNGPFSILSADLKEKALISEGRVIDIPVMKKGVLTVTNVRTCTIGSYENETEMVNLVWTTLVVNISMVKAQYAKNELSYLQDLAKKLKLVKESFANTIEAAIYTKLDTDKSSIYGSSLVGLGNKYPLTANAQQVAAADQPFYFNDVDAIQGADEFWEDKLVLASTNMMPFISNYINQGSGNGENQSFQFAGKKFRFSNAVIDGAGKTATAFVMPLGGIGVLTRVNIDAKMGNSTTDGTQWSTENIDGLPFPVGVMYKSTCSDQSTLNVSGLGHLDATMVEQWQFSIDFATVTAYNSNPVTLASGIKKLEFLP